jgi:hypothetical protein
MSADNFYKDKNFFRKKDFKRRILKDWNAVGMKDLNDFYSNRNVAGWESKLKTLRRPPDFHRENA